MPYALSSEMLKVIRIKMASMDVRIGMQISKILNHNKVSAV